MSEKNSTHVARWIVAIIVLLAVFALGYWLGGLLSGYTDRVALLRKGVPALGIGILLGIMRQVTFIMFKVADFVRTGGRVHLWQPSIAVLFAALTIALAMHLVEITVGESSRGTIVVWNGLRAVPTASEEAPEPSGPYAVFPVFFASEAAGYDPQSRTFAAGTNLATSEARSVRSLVRSLRACAGEGAEVRLSVRGFASSSGYAGYTDAEAADINLLVANSRAAAVAQVVDAEVGDSPDITSETVTWSSIDELQTAQAFDDSTGEEYLPEHGFLTRRAEIVLEDPGGCRVDSESL